MSTDDLTTWDKQLLGEAAIAWAMSTMLLSSSTYMMELFQVMIAGDTERIMSMSKEATRTMTLEQGQVQDRRRVICRVMDKLGIRVPDINLPSGGDATDLSGADWDSIMRDIRGTD